MFDESRQLLKASAVAALLCAFAGMVIFAIVYFMSGFNVAQGALARGPGRLIALCALVTGFLIPHATERITGVCGPIMWMPVIAGGFAGSVVLTLAFAGAGLGAAPATLVAALAVYLISAAISIAMETA